jgi:pimeloyl-ACP methyl ester carboxylesterase
MRLLSLCSVICLLGRVQAIEGNGGELLHWDVYMHPMHLVTLKDGHRLNMYCLGRGFPVVILESGLGWGTVAWEMVHRELAETTRVCAYDRAGIGFSDPGPMPRTSSVIVGDLESLLAIAKIKAPYVLVGHSSGSLDVRLFTDRHLRDVVGMVLVDPSVEYQEQRFDKVAPGHLEQDTQSIRDSKNCVNLIRRHSLRPGTEEYAKCVAPPMSGFPTRVNDLLRREQLRASYQQTCLSEFDSIMGASSAEVAAAQRSYGEMPLIVLTAGETMRSKGNKPNVPMDLQRKVWEEMHEELSKLSIRGVHRNVPGATHMIQRSQPEAVIDAVNEVVTLARSRDTKK